MGIGLALVDRIIKLHDGKVTAYSEGFNQGSRFTIILPRLQQGMKKTEHDIKLDKTMVQIKAINILLVDDNHDAADTTALLLESYGHTVLVEYGAKGALDRVYNEDLDAVILDIGLPEMDGHELCRRLKTVPHLTNAVFIALSGYGQDADRKQSKEAGFDRHLVKPVDLKQLENALASKNVIH